MKKLILLLILLLPVVSFAANSATVGADLDIVIDNFNVKPVKVVYDTVDTDLTLYTPDADKSVAVVGIYLGEADAATLTWKSDTDIITAPNNPAGFVYGIGINPRPLISTNSKGEVLKIQSDVALTEFTVYVVEYTKLRLK